MDTKMSSTYLIELTTRLSVIRHISLHVIIEYLSSLSVSTIVFKLFDSSSNTPLTIR